MSVNRSRSIVVRPIFNPLEQECYEIRDAIAQSANREMDAIFQIQKNIAPDYQMDASFIVLSALEIYGAMMHHLKTNKCFSQYHLVSLRNIEKNTLPKLNYFRSELKRFHKSPSPSHKRSRTKY